MDLYQHTGEVCATIALLLCLPCAAAVPATRGSDKAVESCRSHIQKLVRSLRTAAKTDGAALRVTWLGSENVLLRYDDFSQHMRCLDDVLHVDVQDPAGMNWDRSRGD